MSHPEIIIPFALPPAEHAKDLVKLLTSECGPDGLAMLLGRAQTIQIDRLDDFAPELPHENWLSKKHNINPLLDHRNRLSLELADGFWFLLHPVSLHIASTHLVLTDYRQVALSDEEAQLLFEKAKSLSNEIGLELVYGDANHWFLRADNWSGLKTTTPDSACGHNIEIWSPKGEQELAWRKLQNEIQMEWFIHPVQQQRQQRGQKPINGLWVWSGTMISGLTPIPSKLYKDQHVNNFLSARQLTLIDALSSAALAGDWGSWAQIMKDLDATWFKPLVSALKTQQIRLVNLTLSNTNTLIHVQTSSGSLRKFWKSPSFNAWINV